MSTANEVLKDFMNSLDNTRKQGTAALNEAVQKCSDGMYSTMQEVIDSMLSDIQGSYSTKSFLINYCDIILSNQDTGSIIGSDAGGTTTYTAESIVPENGSTIYTAQSSFTINGLTFNAPDTMTDVEESIVNRIYTWWAEGSLDLIEKAFGISFNESGASAKEINIDFYSENSDTLAYVGFETSSTTGKSDSLILKINLKKFAGMDSTDKNGLSTDGNCYLDRTLAHELTHAAMAVNINYFDKMPDFVVEGLAEVVHGVDDERRDEITELVSDTDKLKAALDLNNTSGKNIDVYAGGYILFRYLAHQVATNSASENSAIDLSEYTAKSIAYMSPSNFSKIRGYKKYGATSENEVSKAKVQGAGTYNIAYDTDEDNIIRITNTDDQKVDFYVMEGKNNYISVSGKGSYEYSGDWTNTYTSGAWTATVDASGMGTRSNVSIAAVDRIYTGAGTNIAWGYNVDKSTITFKENSGNDYAVLWDGVDNDITVNNFQFDNDVVWFYGKGNAYTGGTPSMIKDIDTLLEEYNFYNSGSAIVIEGIKGSVMTINGTSDSFKFITADLSQSYTAEFNADNTISIYDANNNLVGKK